MLVCKADIIYHMTRQRERIHKGLLGAFKRYQKRFSGKGKKPNLAKFLPEIVFRTMRLEGEKITRKQSKALFR